MQAYLENIRIQASVKCLKQLLIIYPWHSPPNSCLIQGVIVLLIYTTFLSSSDIKLSLALFGMKTFKLLFKKILNIAFISQGRQRRSFSSPKSDSHFTG